jgi:hypothetical protein
MKTVGQVLKMARDYYKLPGNGCGGNLHIVLDDGNLETHHAQSCLNWAKEDNDEKGVELAKALLDLTEDQRDTIYQSLFTL